MRNIVTKEFIDSLQRNGKKEYSLRKRSRRKEFRPTAITLVQVKLMKVEDPTAPT
jgi:hypothetical protein